MHGKSRQLLGASEALRSGDEIMNDLPCRVGASPTCENSENDVRMSFRCERELETYGANVGVLVVEL